MTEKYFPQVGDNELMLTEMPHMNLYDETELLLARVERIDSMLAEYNEKHPNHMFDEQTIENICEWVFPNIDANS